MPWANSLAIPPMFVTFPYEHPLHPFEVLLLLLCYESNGVNLR